MLVLIRTGVYPERDASFRVKCYKGGKSYYLMVSLLIEIQSSFTMTINMTVASLQLEPSAIRPYIVLIPPSRMPGLWIGLCSR